MVEFVKSPHEIAQTRHEQQCGEANASNTEPVETGDNRSKMI